MIKTEKIRSYVRSFDQLIQKIEFFNLNLKNQTLIFHILKLISNRNQTKKIPQ